MKRRYPGIRPEAQPVSRYAPFHATAVGRGFSAAECGRVVELASRLPGAPATVARRAGARKVDYAPVARIRSATVCELDYGEETAWVYERVLHLAASANRRLWRVDLSGIFHPLKLIRYGKGDHYDWHTDLGAGIVSDRKLSVTVQLSTASDYAGGNLELLVQPHPLAVPRQLGCAIIFPSYALHRVTPVSMGSRLALVGWIQGPPYR